MTQASPVTPPTETISELEAGSETVLLVEDDHIVRLLMRSTLELKGYHVLDAADADAAIRLCSQHTEPIHLLVTDVIMPGMNGKALAAHLTTLYPEMRALLISGYSLNKSLSDSDTRLPLTFLAKPFTMDELAERVRLILDTTPAESA